MKKYKDFKKAGVVSASIIGLIVCILFFTNMNPIVDVGEIERIESREMKYKQIVLPFLGENNPGAGASGVLEVYVNATNTSTSPYDVNLSGCYATGETNNSHIGSDVPYDTAFDVILKVRWNKTHAYDSTWNLSLVRAYANSTVLGITSIQMEEVQIATSANYVYVAYYLQDADGGAGTGFTIASGVNVTAFTVVFESYYYA